MTLPKLVLRLFTQERDGLFKEVEGFGYRPITLTPAQWEERDDDLHYPEQTFHFTGPAGTIRGWYATAVGSSETVAFARCSPVDIKSRGDQIRFGITARLAHLAKGYDNGS